MTPENQLKRAHELALAAQNANQLFWLLLIGGGLILAYWSLVRWRILHCEARRRAALGAEARRQDEKNALLASRVGDAAYWEGFCKRQKLPESTRITLMASVKKEKVSP